MSCESEHCVFLFYLVCSGCLVVSLILIDSFQAIVWFCRKSQRFGKSSLKIGFCAYCVEKSVEGMRECVFAIEEIL